jgi:hypothetical protein
VNCKAIQHDVADTARCGVAPNPASRNSVEEVDGSK